MSELRWNPLYGEWVATATHRQERTFLPPSDFCPLCPTKANGFPTEIPESDFDIVVFENRFPALSPVPPAPSVEATEISPVESAAGACEVIVYSPDHNTTLANEPPKKIYHLIKVWTDRYIELAKRQAIRYVFIFENKGEAIGVTLHHPHGQIYAYPFIPPKVERQLYQAENHLKKTGKNLFDDIIATEKSDGRRIVAENESFLAVIPFFARYPFETHIYAKKQVSDLAQFSEKEQKDLAKILKKILIGFDNLFGVSFPYIMALHQSPTDGKNYDFFRFHIEFYPPLRTAQKLKFLAGSEAGAGMFINDTLPEEKAAELRAKIPN